MKHLPVILLCLIVCSSCFAQSSLVDPCIPDNEKITYASNFEGNRSILITEETNIRTESGREIYEITSKSEFEDKQMKFLKSTMALVYVWSVRKFPDASFESKYDFSVKKDGETKISDFSTIRYVFRGFPFEKTKSLKLDIFGRQGDQAYSVTVKVLKKEKVKTEIGIIECYKLELGMNGFWAGFFPKMHLWYSVSPSHYLVKFEGSNMVQQGKRVIELKSYTRSP
ncbi:hypothetical protein AUJ67_08675 [Candidatus Desantisbacteria bacterium CG1_02_49_89]|nr:MAG: hypothetical protein AUJ67_08675 [Candidatus Desantisbacteria bacterium CG1_02_49_89]